MVGRARFWISIRWFRKGQAFTLRVFLVRRFLNPIQLSTRLCVVFHLPIPIVLFDWVQQTGQLTTLFRRELINCRLDLFHATHVQTLFASRARTRPDQCHVTIRRRTSRLRVRRAESARRTFVQIGSLG